MVLRSGGGRVVIRPVIEADFEQWLPLWKGYNAFYGRRGKTALAKEITLTTWRRFFEPYEPVHVPSWQRRRRSGRPGTLTLPP